MDSRVGLKIIISLFLLDNWIVTIAIRALEICVYTVYIPILEHGEWCTLQSMTSCSLSRFITEHKTKLNPTINFKFYHTTLATNQIRFFEGSWTSGYLFNLLRFNPKSALSLEIFSFYNLKKNFYGAPSHN